ncbi:energy-coupling factor transporter transmembrane component T [Corynebacterium lubricantis]|uniref:energy-coupling factor transporter transmembrane component T n=1 Tax=Corynebacterium lubricantis TaxID=541095 RepID=UPI00316AC6FB
MKTRNLSVPLAVLVLAIPLGLSMVLVHAPYGDNQIAPLITSDGLALAGALTLRFSALMSCLLAAMTFVTIPELVKALQVSPLGNRIAYIVGSALQFLPQGRLAVQRARDANALVGRKINLRTVIPHLALPVMTSVLSQGAARGQALETAGYDIQGKRTVLVPVADSPAQRVLRYTVPIVCLAVVIWI